PEIPATPADVAPAAPPAAGPAVLSFDAALLNGSGLVGATGAPTGAVTWTQLTDSGSPPDTTAAGDSAFGGSDAARTPLAASGVGFAGADPRGDVGALDQLFTLPDLRENLQAL